MPSSVLPSAPSCRHQVGGICRGRGRRGEKGSGGENGGRQNNRWLDDHIYQGLLFHHFVKVGLLNWINCYPVPRGTRNHSREALWNSGVTSADSGLQLDLGIALNGVSAKIQPHGLIQPAEDKLKRRMTKSKMILLPVPRTAYRTLVQCVSGGIKAVCDHGDLRSPPSQGSLRYRDWSKLCRALILWAQPEGWVTQTVSSERCCRDQNG